MIDAHNDIVDIVVSGGGETITMADGSVWLHSFSGRAPTRVRPPTRTTA